MLHRTIFHYPTCDAVFTSEKLLHQYYGKYTYFLPLNQFARKSRGVLMQDFLMMIEEDDKQQINESLLCHPSVLRYLEQSSLSSLSLSPLSSLSLLSLSPSSLLSLLSD